MTQTSACEDADADDDGSEETVHCSEERQTITAPLPPNCKYNRTVIDHSAIRVTEMAI